IIRQALKAGNIDFRQENTAKAWAQEYDVPVVRQGWLRKERFEHDNPTGMQSFAMNIRREVFQDRRVRRALAYAFDFEWTNRNLFYGQYTRTESFFSNSELAFSGLPSEDELEILEPYRGQVPNEVFTKEYFAPSTDGSGWPRDNLRRAFELLAEAGWVVRDMKLVDAETGRQMSFEILLVSQAFERIALPFKRNLERLGIEVRVRTVDSAQYINRLRSFDFDMIVASWGQSASPGNEQRDFWGSDAADSPGSRNYVGIEDPAIDDLIDLIISAPDRESLITRTRALDRVLLWNHFVIPQWHIEYDRILYWNKFGFPEEPPRQGTSINYWWIDPAKARALASRTPQQAETEARGDGTMLGRIALYAGIAALLLFGYLSLRRLNRRSAH
ncbi:MAG TPA: extracellular solute-binding protein, partial [Kiloniellales bacterium]|nr:extracellular solute-binding protein [Kiloniellales bacterium]